MFGSMSEAQTIFPERKESVDSITNLPEDVRLRILECLPLQDAVRTGILSTHWRYEWGKLPHIVLDEEFFFAVALKRVVDSDISTTYSNIIDGVLHNHVGPLRKFVLYVPLCLANDSKLCEWLQFVSQQSVSDLVLFYDICNMEELASTVFLFSGLTRLTLRYCTVLKLPPTFHGFQCLVSLELLGCDWGSVEVLEELVRSCGQLQLLRFDNLEADELTIHASKLVNLQIIEGFFRKLHLGNETTQIKMLHLDFTSDTPARLTFSTLPILQCLRLGPSYLMYLWKLGDEGFISDLLRLQTQSLELISVPIHFPFICYFVLKLLSTSRPLQRLYCEVPEYDFRTYGMPNSKLTHAFSKPKWSNCASLKYVDFVCVSGSRNELQFIKIILAIAPMLEVMTISFSKMVEAQVKLDTTMELMQQSRASTNAQIIFKTCGTLQAEECDNDATILATSDI